MKNFPVHGQNNYLLLKKLKNQNVAHPRFVVICKIQAIALKWWKQHINSIIYIDTAALRTRGQNLDIYAVVDAGLKGRPQVKDGWLHDKHPGKDQFDCPYCNESGEWVGIRCGTCGQLWDLQDEHAILLR